MTTSPSEEPFVGAVFDSKNRSVVVGSRVRCAPEDFDEKGRPNTGEVVEITEPDGDVDDDGRTIGISPRVVVMYDNGDMDTYVTSTHRYFPGFYEEPEWLIEDVDVITQDGETRATS